MYRFHPPCSSWPVHLLVNSRLLHDRDAMTLLDGKPTSLHGSILGRHHAALAPQASCIYQSCQVADKYRLKQAKQLLSCCTSVHLHCETDCTQEFKPSPAQAYVYTQASVLITNAKEDTCCAAACMCLPHDPGPDTQAAFTRPLGLSHSLFRQPGRRQMQGASAAGLIIMDDAGVHRQHYARQSWLGVLLLLQNVPLPWQA